MTYTLPQEVLELVEMNPVEDILLGVLRTQLPGIDVQTLIQYQQGFPFVLARAYGSWGDWDGDPRFLDAAQVNIHTFCDGVNADEESALLSEAVRVVLRDSINVPVMKDGKSLGHLTKADMMVRPRRVTDWATATGPVQYADLPQGVFRWETVYHVEIRRPYNKFFANP